MFYIYLLCFYAPFLVTVFSNNGSLENILYSIAMLTQLFFFLVEMIQIKNAGTNYFKESVWNVIEFGQFWLFIIYVVIRVSHGLGQDDANNYDFLEIVLQLFIVIFGFFKVLFFIRIYADYGFLVQMVGMTIV